MFTFIFILIIVIVLLYLYAISPRFSRRKDMLRYRHTMFAHRGYHCAKMGVPENSMSAFRAALNRGYGIEIDLHLTRDGKLVVFHDDTLERICGRPDTVESLTYEELKNCRLSGTAETIPTFHEVLSLVNGRVPLLIELKIPDSSIHICRETLKALSYYPGSLPDPVLQYHGNPLVPAACAAYPAGTALLEPNPGSFEGGMAASFHGKAFIVKFFRKA